MSMNLYLSELVAVVKKTKSGKKKLHETVLHDLYQTPTHVSREAMSKTVPGNQESHMNAFKVYEAFVLNKVGNKPTEDYVLDHLDEVRRKVENGAQFYVS